MLGAATLLAAVWAGPATSPAGAVTIGQLAGAPTNTFCGNANSDYLQPTVTFGNTYVVPPFGATVTEWSTQAGASAPGALVAFKAYRLVAGTVYQVVGADTPRTIIPFSLNRFPVNIPVQPGDVIGFNLVNGNVAAHTCDFAVPGESYLFKFPGLAVGQSGTYTQVNLNARLNVAAEVKPSNEFSFGKLKRRKKKGIAVLKVQVPGPGTLALAGKGIKGIGARASKTVDGPGTVNLKIRAKGKAKKRLNSRGKTKVKAKVTYTPTGGDPNTKPRKAKLKKA
ncbi:MAG: hypothetical protein ACRDL6_08425 [Solirubrobacterales bacterium]